MKLTIVAMEIPYPAVHGGRIDIWRRLKMLAKMGVEIQLICWCHEVPDTESFDIINQYVKEFYPITYKQTLGGYIRRVIDLSLYPLEVTSRIVRGKKWKTLLSSVNHFQPDVILCDQIHGGWVASRLSKALKIPMIIRSHNIEYLHYRYYFESAKGYSKLLRFLSLNQLENYEKSLLKQSLAFYDISNKDLKFWQEQGFKNGYFLPPLIEFNQQPKQKTGVVNLDVDQNIQELKSYDVVFLGNLHSENNVAGIIWFIEEVFPILKERLPSIRVLIAGSNPNSQIKTILKNSKDLDFKINPPSAEIIYQSGRVLIDPIATGSGVSIKSIDMLAIGNPIVSRPKGLSGLPEEASQYFRVASDAPSFAHEILTCLSEEQLKVPDRALLESLFGYPVIESFLSHLHSILK
ncbi:glycosyl transferase 4-like family protein [Lyngbya aestuarii BL J]|uniref:Glycosyl transferase 4-like family protein n=2 Tax=Lyngbya aestuarii TaxID=118322 RepID=U7QGW2_9CYAN|nr:glycosyl transferase 4-like family protein [Lyngbya aestuarii BL J]ERT05671.1 glycosyl transferase 4-like family protein [Lyngbya aestuarii BL J]